MTDNFIGSLKKPLDISQQFALCGARSQSVSTTATPLVSATMPFLSFVLQ